MNSFWKKPARLWRRRERAEASFEQVPLAQVNSGLLEDMVLCAVARGAISAEEADALFIDVDAEQILSWSEIRALFRSPTFPIQI